MPESTVVIIGAGLSGCECAWQLSLRGCKVLLYEMKPEKFSPAHTTADLAELVCSNSLRSNEPDTAIGQLKQELRKAGSLIMQAADATRLPAGKALAVDRKKFSAHITQAVLDAPGITLIRKEIRSLDQPDLKQAAYVVLAAGPLVSSALAGDLMEKIGSKELYFYDAIAPVLDAQTVNMKRAFWGSRYRPEEDDYLNCPMNEEEYLHFYNALMTAETVKPKPFEKEIHFEGCLPVEELARRGVQTLTFGPLKPVGLVNPRSTEKPYAVVQLRAENTAKTHFNMVGFQTKLTYPEQKRVFSLIPALKDATFTRFGSIHRNTYVNAPQVLTPFLELRAHKNTCLTGQITGVEGYVESTACGLWLGMHLAGCILGKEVPLPPVETALGALLGHLQVPCKNFQPSNIQFGLMPPLHKKAGKRERKKLYAKRAAQYFDQWWNGLAFFP